MLPGIRYDLALGNLTGQLLALLLLASCTGAGKADLQPAQQGLPDVRAVLSREAQAAGSSADGAQSIAQSSGVVVEQQSLLIDNVNGMQLEWAIYRLGPVADEDRRLDVELELLAGEAWLALGDANLMRWSFEPVATGPRSIRLDPQKNVTDSGDVLCAVVVEPGSSLRIAALKCDAAPEWSMLTIANGDAPGEELWLGELDGRPAMGFLEVYARTYHFARSSSRLGTALEDWQLSQPLVDSVSNRASLALIDGRPALAYMDGQRVRYALSSSENAAAPWPSVEVLDRPAYGLSLAVVGGLPALAVQTNQSRVVYVASSSASGAAAGDWSHHDVDIVGSAGYDLQLIDNAGHPAIAHQANQTELRYCIAGQALPQSKSDWSILELSGPRDVSSGVGICLIEEAPAIAWFDMQEKKLMLSVSSTAKGMSAEDWSQQVVSEADWPAMALSLAVVSGQPSIVYLGYEGLHTKFIESSGSFSSPAADWGNDTVLDSAALAAAPMVLAEINGYPAILYRDDKQLKYAIRH